MTSLSEEDLLRMSLTGKSPTSSSFDHEKTLGNKAFKEGRHTDAIRHYSNAEQINPLSPIPPANRAMAHLKLQNWQAAKADASIALELYNTLPQSTPGDPLPVKILLRRATANAELLLYALAADDYAHALRLDPANATAKEKLHELKTVYSVTPSASAVVGAEAANAGKGKIELISSQRSANGAAHTGPSNEVPRMEPQTPQDETALVELPADTMNRLIDRWSGKPPNSSLEFERAWKSLGADKMRKAAYLIETVGPYRLSRGLLGESLTPQLLEDIAHVLAVAVATDAACSAPAADILHALTTVSRFAMLTMFLSEKDKQPIHALLKRLSENGVPSSKVCALQGAYA